MTHYRHLWCTLPTPWHATYAAVRCILRNLLVLKIINDIRNVRLMSIKIVLSWCDIICQHLEKLLSSFMSIASFRRWFITKSAACCFCARNARWPTWWKDGHLVHCNIIEATCSIIPAIKKSMDRIKKCNKTKHVEILFIGWCINAFGISMFF